MTKTVFTPDQFDNLIKMGSSSDKENQMLALQLIETVPFQEHLVYIMLLKKLGKIESATWKEHGNKTYLKLKKVVDVDRVITYKKIFDMLGKVKSNKDQVEFFLNYFAKYLENQCKALGYDFIETLEIKIKTKNETESGIISERV